MSFFFFIQDDIIIDTINITCHIPLLLVKQEANITINSRLWIESNALNSTRNFRIASQMNIIQSPVGNATLNAMVIQPNLLCNNKIYTYQNYSTRR